MDKHIFSIIGLIYGYRVIPFIVTMNQQQQDRANEKKKKQTRSNLFGCSRFIMALGHDTVWGTHRSEVLTIDVA